tara:strand:+ start:69 stop:692 length:624 start_codon:yes stop_codon:yes gene_type:complete
MAYGNQKQNNYIIQELIDLFNKFPGIGPKSAQRLAYFTINQNHDEVKKFAETLLLVKEKISLCEICQDFTIDQKCKCQDISTNKELLCVVEDPMDIIAIDNSNAYSGTFHVLHGVISPTQGIGPDDLKIKELIDRISSEASLIKEVIIATNPNLEGEATAMYITKMLEPFNVKVSRLARGLPSGGDLEYTDGVTIGKAIEYRQEIEL